VYYFGKHDHGGVEYGINDRQMQLKYQSGVLTLRDGAPQKKRNIGVTPTF
jgi:hypothetical protein